MYRRPKFLEVLLEIRRDMAHEADYDVDLFVELARHGTEPETFKRLNDATPKPDSNGTQPTNDRVRQS